MKKKLKKYAIALACLVSFLVAGVLLLGANIWYAKYRADNFCSSIRVGESVDEIALKIKESTFDRLVFMGNNNQILRVERQNQWNGSLSSNYNGVIVRFLSRSPSLFDCEIQTLEGKVVEKKLKEHR